MPLPWNDTSRRREAQALNPSPGADWADDLAADLALARG
jgi:hypothetical protein